MIDWIFQIGLSNAFVALLLAFAALIVGMRAKRAQLAHVLWLFVLIKLITPPLVNLPVASFRQVEPTTAVTGDDAVLTLLAMETSESEAPQSTTIFERVSDWWQRSQSTLAVLWILGSLAMVGRSFVLVRRFHRLLQESQVESTSELNSVAASLARELGLKQVPAVLMTTARISPMVWWVGGRVHVVMPVELMRTLKPAEWRMVLAHELAHVYRRDYSRC